MQPLGAEESLFDFPPPKKRLCVFGSRLPLAAMSQNLPSRVLPTESTQPYQSLFQPAAEFPRFVVSYRWWEDEATTVFWAFNIPDISRVIRYGLFRDTSFPRNSLLSRNADTIDAFLKAMSEPHEQQLLGNLSHLQRVEEILRRSSIPALELVPWSWFPLPSGHSLDARAIASAIEAESHFQFCKIAFEEIVRASLGYNAPSVEWFLLQHTALYIHLLEHLQTYPEEIPLYINVETVSPANWFDDLALILLSTYEPEVPSHTGPWCNV